VKYAFPFITFLLLLLCIELSNAQGTYTPPKVSAKAEKDLESAVLLAQSGNTEAAVSQISDIIAKNPGWTLPRQQLARIYYDADRKQEAIQQLEATLAIDTISQLNELYALGRIYEEVSQPDRAMACYNAVIRNGMHAGSIAQKAAASLASLEKKKTLWENTGTITFHSFDADINTPNHESLGRWTLDGQQMIFTRLIADQEEIFFATFDTIAKIWKIEDFPHNTPQREGAHAISPDGNYLIFTGCLRDDGFGSCDLYLSTKENGQWTKPVNMGPAFNSVSWDGQPCFGLDGLSLYYSSSRPGGMGGRDIWYVYQISAGKWSNPINAGPAINTADNEESPFVHFDGRTLYFMRDGKAGLGGYDLYMSRMEIDNKWQPAENFGSPVNSGADEGALTLHPDGHHAIITRMTDQAKNDLFTFELPEKFRSEPMQGLNVTIVDDLSGKPIRARLELFEISEQDTIRATQWTDNDGKLSAATRRNTSYGVMVYAEGYMLFSMNLDPDTSAVRQLAIRLSPLAAAAEKVIVLHNIFFETASSTLLPNSEPELNKLLWTLRKNPGIKIEIRGHTDNVGEEKVNQELSEARAKSVYQYLVDRGVEASRLSYVGFGETQPIADNTTEEGRKENRRTEFKMKNEE
jgi:outer membrane protein OmpA-like peptidoglycan-associated protein